MKKIGKKLVVFTIVLSFALSPFTAIPARAQYVDVVQASKELGLDTVAWMLINSVIEKIAASTVKWINSGFKGQPAYVTDPLAEFALAGKEAANRYINFNPAFDVLCSPIKAKLKIALITSYNNRIQKDWECTVDDIENNLENFVNDFSQGSWDTFFEVTQKDQNNPILAFLQAESEMEDKMEKALDLKEKDLSWGSGFMSFKKCNVDIKKPGDACTEACGESENPEECYDSCMQYAGSASESQLCGLSGGSMQTATPGTVINDQLNDVLGSSMGKLEAADEINEIVSALLNQLAGRVFSSVSGLRGASNPGPSGESPLIQQLMDESGDVDVVDQPGVPGSQMPDSIKVDDDTIVLQDPDACDVTEDTSCVEKPVVPRDLDCKDGFVYPLTVNNANADIKMMPVGSSERINAVQELLNLDCGNDGIRLK